VGWGNFFPKTARLVELPTYPFQRKRHWFDTGPANSDANSFGLSSTEHPLLTAVLPLADGAGMLLTGRLCASEHRWLSEHKVFDTDVPGTGVLEMILAGARAVGCASIDELILMAPLAVAERGAQRVQLQVDAPDERGRRPWKLYARNETAVDDEPWQCHATGLLAPEPESSPRHVDLETWPPHGAQAVDLADLYRRLAARGLAYGSAFQVWSKRGAMVDALSARQRCPRVSRRRQAPTTSILRYWMRRFTPWSRRLAIL
jgi:acyl transferase domain-containing protein